MSDANISIPDVDSAIAQKLEAVVGAITSATGTFQTTSEGLGFTQSSVNGAVSSIVDISEGQMVDKLSTIWNGTSNDGQKADSGLTGVIPHLNSLKGTINDHLPAIRTGLTAIQTALGYQHNSQEVEADIASRLQEQINGLITALGAITSATGPVNTGINSIIVGGSCGNGIQPGDPLPTFDNRSFMTKKGPDGKPSPDDLRRARADASQARTSAANAENASINAETRTAVDNAKTGGQTADHIFRPTRHDHKWELTGLDEEGNWGLIQQTLEGNYAQLPSQGVYEVTKNFGSYTVTVRGAMVNGVIRIGTSFVNPV